MESYVIRIYRRERNPAGSIAGIIEEAGSNDGMRPFRTAGELLDFLIEGGSGDENSVMERREAERLTLKLPVKISGTDLSGMEFAEESVLEDLSSKGAYFLIKADVTIGSVLNIVIDPLYSRLVRKARVVRVVEQPTEKWVGVVL